MLKGKLYKSKVDDESEFLTETKEEEILICLNCTLSNCNKFYCKRYEEEKAKLKAKGG